MKVVIFGNGKFASLAWYCLKHDSPYEVAGFTVDDAYATESQLHGLPVAPFSKASKVFAPGEHAMLVHVGAIGMNRLRRDRLDAAKTAGFAPARYVSSRAMTWPDLSVGDNVAIYEGTIIQPFATVGDNVIIRSAVHVSHHCVVEADCFLSAGVCMGGSAQIGRSSFVGLNATIRDGVRVAEGCLIGAGAVVTEDTAPDGVYIGVPARRTATPASEVYKYQA